MKKVALIIIAIVLYASADDPWACDANGKCRPGLRCVDGRCVSRPDCPHRGIPEVPPGCKLTTYVDENDCPRTKVEC